MEFRFRLYRTADGKCPVEDLLGELFVAHPWTHARVIAGLRKLRDSKNHGEPLTKSLKPEWDLWEMRADRARVFWVFRPKQLIVLLGGVPDKDQPKLPRRILQIYDDYRRDYLARCTNEEDRYDERL